MKKLFNVVLFIFLLSAFIEAAYVGKVYFKPRGGTSGNLVIFNVKPINLATFFAKEIQAGNLKLLRIQKDPQASMEHHRYSQFYKGLEVFGAQIIQHYKNGKLQGINGEYYKISNVEIIPSITRNKAVKCFKQDLNKEGLEERREDTKLLIYPLKDGDYRLAYKITLEKGIGYSMTGIVDAKSGALLLKYSNINTENFTIGKGIGCHSEIYKLPTIYLNNIYWLADEKKVRPVNQYTYDFNTFDGDAYYIASDYDNYWDYDGALVNAHAFLGWTYDYYYLLFGRKGIDDNNLDIIANVHWYDPNYLDNAYWDGSELQMFFGDPGPDNYQTAAALDVVTHEYSHGVTQFTSELEYYCTEEVQPGALNVSFSDFMGTAVEFYWQERGNEFNKADWVCGEDIFPDYSADNYLRSLSDPNSKQDDLFNLPYPCHLYQCYIFPNTEEWDWGGVHFNSTLYSHAYYLLSKGGTNRVSHKSVSGIGIDKATNIFYHAWSFHLTPTASFLDAANALLQSAYDLYGSSSNEYAKTIKAMEAIGWDVY